MIYLCSLNVSNDAILAGKSIVTTLDELYVALADTTARLLEMETDFVEKYFTSRSLAVFLSEAKKVNRFLEIKAPAKFVKSNRREIEKLKKIKTPDGMVSYLLQDPSALRLIHSLCEDYEHEQSEVLRASAKLSTMHLEQAAMAKEMRALEDKYSILNELYQLSTTRLETLVSRINYRYDKDVDPNKMVGVSVEFRKYTKILYVKELTRVVYTDTLIYYLQEILKTLYGVPTRFVVIEPAYAYGRIELYPKCKDHLNLSYGDLYNSDIFMAGFQSGLMEDILANPSNVKFLIVLDRSGWKWPYITGDGVEVIYTVSDIKDIKQNIPLKRVVSYNKDTLHIPHIQGFDGLSMEERIGKYSSMPATQMLIELMERGD